MEKVTSFYREKNAEAMRKFNTLKEQLSLSEEPNMRNNQVRQKISAKIFTDTFFRMCILGQERMARS